MRKGQLLLVKEMSGLLKQAHESIRKVISEKEISEDDLNAVYSLLSQCQSAAINIGNRIEESEGGGFITVKYLEDYCELVYSINEELQTNAGTNNPDKVYKKLTKMLQKIDNSITHDIPLKREAVFLPYKASMWDSLESVWEAADADPDCDAYVIPIPYFDRNPDGSVREEYYEGDLFPDNIPITHYSEFDFGKHHPDMIFIHNPYDYGNLVTTIHPFFYAENMKKVTDCLVYIPYFATSGGMSESRAWCPVYDYVDYIVIQHESFRKYYSVDIPEEKFLPLGSPKFDKVIKKCQNPPKPKEEWQKRMDGRKVFFYNTSLNGMLQDTPQFLRKMQYVFETFKNHPECCLLWRPHPLFESTLHAMRPECIEVFNALKQDFLKQENWIYDDTPSVEDTIAICDGYIGDSASSIVALFGVAGKRIFILDNKISESNYNATISRLLLSKQNKRAEYDSGIEYALTEENILYKLEGDYSYKRCMTITNSVMCPAYGQIYRFGEDIIIAPCLEENVIIIDANKNLKRIELEEQGKGWQFSESYLVDGKLLLVPHDYAALVIIDLNNKKINYLYDVGSFINSKDSEGNHYGISWIDGEEIYITDSFCNKYMRINVNTLSKTIIDMNLNVEGKRAVVFDEKEKVCWIIHINGPYVTRFCYKNQKKETIDLYVDGLSSTQRNKYYFENIVKNGNYIYFSPLYATIIVRLDLRTLKAEEYSIKGTSNDNKAREYGYFINNKKLSFYNYNSGKCFEIDDESINEYTVVFPKEDIKFDLMKFGEYGNGCRYCNVEKVHNLLEDYLNEYDLYRYDFKMQIEAYSKVNASVLGNAGEKIYKYVCVKDDE